MAMTWRTGGLFAAGLLVGVTVGGWAVIQAHNKAVWQDNGPTHSMGNAPPAESASTAQATPVSAPVPVATVAAQSCDATAIVPRGREDGQASLQSAPSTATASEVSALLLTGKEAAASGRMRDAEIVFLNACRDAQVVQGKDAGLPLADAMYQLGRHYATVAQSGGGSRNELLARSQRLYQAALQTYQARYGDKGEKTRFAQQGLATVQRLAGGAPLPAAPTVAQAPAPVPARGPAAAKPPSPPPVAAVQPARPEEARSATVPAHAIARPRPPAAVEARALPTPPKPAERVHAEKPAHEEPATASVQTARPAPRVEPARPVAAPTPAIAGADSAPQERPPRARREAARPVEPMDAASDSAPQVSVARSRPAPARAAPVESEGRPTAPPREPARRAPRSEDNAREESSAPPGTASGNATAEGSAGNP